MAGDLLLFCGFALVYSGLWWVIARHSLPASRVVDDDEEDEVLAAEEGPVGSELRPPALASTVAAQPQPAAPLPCNPTPAPVPPRVAAAASAMAWAHRARTTSLQPPPYLPSNASDGSAEDQPPILILREPPAPLHANATSPAGPPTDAEVAVSIPKAWITEPTEAQPPPSPRAEPPPAHPAAPATPTKTTMTSNPLDFPQWMEEPKSTAREERATAPASGASPAARSESAARKDASSENATRGGVTSSEPTAPKSTAPKATKTISMTPSTNKPTTTTTTARTEKTTETTTDGTEAGDTVEALGQFAKERQEHMARLDAWSKAWADLEKQAACELTDLTKQVAALARARAESEQRVREVEQQSREESTRRDGEAQVLRAKVAEFEPFVAKAREATTKCTALEQEISGHKTTLEEQKRERAALEERIRALAAEGEKLKDHLTRSQEATKEATARELDWQGRYNADTAKLTQLVTSKTQEVERWIGENQKMKVEVDRQRGELRTRDEAAQTMAARCKDLEQLVAKLQSELEEHKAAEAEQMGMLQAAQGVLAELQPKLQLLEKKLTKH
jgi:hypothetical protein